MSILLAYPGILYFCPQSTTQCNALLVQVHPGLQGWPSKQHHVQGETASLCREVLCQTSWILSFFSNFDLVIATGWIQGGEQLGSYNSIQGLFNPWQREINFPSFTVQALMVSTQTDFNSFFHTSMTGDAYSLDYYFPRLFGCPTVVLYSLQLYAKV